MNSSAPTSGSFRAITTTTSTRASSSLPSISGGCRDVVVSVVSLMSLWTEERPEEPPEEIRLGDIEEAMVWQEDWHKVKGSNSMCIFKGASCDAI